MKTRTKNKPLYEKKLICEKKKMNLGYIISSLAIAGTFLQFALIVPLIISSYYSSGLAILFFLIEIFFTYKLFFMYKKYPEVFKNIPYFHKKDPSINIRTKFFSLELKNHHNYFSQESVKAQFFIFNIFRQIGGILIINISVIIISIFSMMMQGFSLIDAIKWSLFFDFIAIILQFLSYKNSKKDIDPELLFSHYYILKMNPKSYCIRGNNIFFY